MKKILTLVCIISALLFSVFPETVNAQEDVNERINPKFELPHRHKSIGLNMTPLLVQLIPFNRSNPNIAGPYTLSYRSFRGKGAFRFGLGAFVTEESIDGDGRDAHFNMRFGYEKRKVIYERWAYSFGMDFFLSSGNFNLIGSTGSNSDGSTGLGFVWGTEYFLNPKVSLGLESQFLLGFNFDDAPTLLFVPPVALYLNFIIPKRNPFKR